MALARGDDISIFDPRAAGGFLLCWHMVSACHAEAAETIFDGGQRDSGVEG
jgi:hypothetical protein